jgi:hypothetical protein
VKATDCPTGNMCVRHVDCGTANQPGSKPSRCANECTQCGGRNFQGPYEVVSACDSSTDAGSPTDGGAVGGG